MITFDVSRSGVFDASTGSGIRSLAVGGSSSGGGDVPFGLAAGNRSIGAFAGIGGVLFSSCGNWNVGDGGGGGGGDFLRIFASY